MQCCIGVAGASISRTRLQWWGQDGIYSAIQTGVSGIYDCSVSRIEFCGLADNTVHMNSMRNAENTAYLRNSDQGHSSSLLGGALFGEPSQEECNAPSCYRVSIHPTFTRFLPISFSSC